jgi:pyrimidine operon attenuation protein/uracil phosphoribosyltransferase
MEIELVLDYRLSSDMENLIDSHHHLNARYITMQLYENITHIFYCLNEIEIGGYELKNRIKQYLKDNAFTVKIILMNTQLFIDDLEIKEMKQILEDYKTLIDLL